MRFLYRLPYSAAATSEMVRAESVRIKPYQIIVWVSVGIRQVVEWDQLIPCLPAVLDTGSNHNFSISHTHLVSWAGIQPTFLQHLRTISERGNRVPLYSARLWLHPNIPGQRRIAGVRPIQLKIVEGIAIHPDATAPRLPVLGLRALTRNDLCMTLDSERRVVHLRTPDWRTKLGRWLP